MSIGLFVKAKRKEQDISQKQLAEYAEVSFTLVNRIENGDQKLRLITLNKVLEVFGHQMGPVPKIKFDMNLEKLDE